MAKIDEKTKLLILAALANGASAREASEKFDCSYSSAIKIKKDYEQAVENNTLVELTKVDQLVFDNLIELVKDQSITAVAPLGQESQVVEATKEITDTVSDLKNLDENMQVAANNLLTNISAMALTVSTPEGVEKLSNSLSRLRETFFAKDTNVNVNNFTGDSNWSQLMRD